MNINIIIIMRVALKLRSLRLVINIINITPPVYVASLQLRGLFNTNQCLSHHFSASFVLPPLGLSHEAEWNRSHPRSVARC